MAFLGFNSNIGSLTAQRYLERSSRAVERSSTRLSSGSRINQASDDAAGLAIASGLNSRARVYGRAILNANDGISALSIAQGSVDQLSNILVRVKELAEQAANGSYSRTQRLALDKEANALTNEYNRITSTTSFNGLNIFQDLSGRLSVQLGYGNSGQLGFSVGSGIGRNTGTGFNSASYITNSSGGSNVQSVATSDFNNDGKLDLVTAGGDATNGSLLVRIGNGDGTFQSVSQTLALPSFISPTSIIAQDFTGDGIEDLLISGADLADAGQVMFARGNANGTFNAATTVATGNVVGSQAIDAGDVNSDGKVDFVFDAKLYLGNGNGTFQTPTSLTSQGLLVGNPLHIADINADGKADIIGASSSNAVRVLYGNGAGAFTVGGTYTAATSSIGSISTDDFNHDGILDLLVSDYTASQINTLLGNENGTFQTRSSTSINGFTNVARTADFNNDGNADIIVTTASRVAVQRGRGDGTFDSAQVYTGVGATANSTVGDLNGDGVLDIVNVGALTSNNVAVLLATKDTLATTQRFDLTTQAKARTTLDLVDTALERVASEFGVIGSAQKRLEIAVNNLYESRENHLSAESRITDVDVASESAELARQQILQNVATSVLAQVNRAPEIALSLLRE